MRIRIGVGALLSTMLACSSVVMVSCQTPPAAPEKLKVVDGMQITMEYTITLPDHTIAASNVGQEPLSYIQGRHEIFPTLEAAVAGMWAGEKKVVALTPDQAFGPYDEKKKLTVKREQLPLDAKVGSLVSTNEGLVATVVSMTDTSAVLDFNHPLAGKDLVFDVTVLKVEQP
jgi:FKBP-type peptidyl-prolyl cis-trans isomerase 2